MREKGKQIRLQKVQTGILSTVDPFLDKRQSDTAHSQITADKKVVHNILPHLYYQSTFIHLSVSLSVYLKCPIYLDLYHINFVICVC